MIRRLAGLTSNDLPLITVGVVVGCVCCGVVGFVDYGRLGGLVGGFAGAFAGYLAGYCLSLVAEVTIGPRHMRGRGWQRRLFHSARRLLQLAFMLAICYEIHWILNFQTLANDYAIGAKVLVHAQRQEDPAQLAERLENKRWLVALGAARPLRWAMHQDYIATHEAVLHLIDAVGANVQGPGPQDPMPDIVPVAVDASWRDEQWREVAGSEQKLAKIGAAICSYSQSRMTSDRTRTLLLRFLPNELFLIDAPLVEDLDEI